MPLVEEEAVRTDRRFSGKGLWLAVIGGIVLVWVLGAVVALMITAPLQSVVQMVPAAAPPSAPVPGPYSNPTVQQAVAAFGTGNYQLAAGVASGIKNPRRLSVIDRHAINRVAAESNTLNGNPAAAAPYYEELLRLTPRIGGKACRSCHGPSAGPGAMPPAALADTQFSNTGRQWTNALATVGQLQATRDRLAAQLAKRPKDVALLVLLHHVERDLGNTTAATQHLAALMKRDAAAAKSAPGK
jgi:hypothetical protein